MKSNSIRNIFYIVVLATVAGMAYHFGTRWWAHRQVNQIIFKDLPQELIKSLSTEWKKETKESAEWHNNVIGEAFVGAACSNDEQISGYFLHAGYSPNMQNSKGITPLHCAAGNGNIRLAKNFLSAGANLKARTNEDEFVPLHYAASLHQWDMVRFLLKKGVSINEVSKHGTAVMIVANEKIVRRIVNSMGTHFKDIQGLNEPLATSINLLGTLGATLDTVAPDGNTLMHYAASVQDTILMDVLANKYGQLANVKNQRGETPLIFAFRDRPWLPTNGAGSHVATVEWLVRNGVDINARDENGWSIALIAVREESLLALLTPGLDLNVADNKGESIWSSPARGPVEFAKTQATIGVPLMLNGQPGRGPLHVAAKEPSLDATKYFLQRGVSPNQIDQDGLTPLHEVLRWTGGSGDVRITRPLIVKILLDAGADVNARTLQGLTPLMLARDQPGEIIQMLVDRKADVNAVVMENGRQVSVMDSFLRRANTKGMEILLKASARKTHPR